MEMLGDRVRRRWRDGSYVIGTIVEIEESLGGCLFCHVAWDDGSQDCLHDFEYTGETTIPNGCEPLISCNRGICTCSKLCCDLPEGHLCYRKLIGFRAPEDFNME